jgi:hypothetical protein
VYKKEGREKELRVQHVTKRRKKERKKEENGGLMEL